MVIGAHLDRAHGGFDSYLLHGECQGFTLTLSFGLP